MLSKQFQNAIEIFFHRKIIRSPSSRSSALLALKSQIWSQNGFLKLAALWWERPFSPMTGLMGYTEPQGSFILKEA
jgi:hypothetical protein